MEINSCGPDKLRQSDQLKRSNIRYSLQAGMRITGKSVCASGDSYLLSSC